MTSKNLENLAKIGKLKAEPPAQAEIDGLLRSGSTRLNDARKPANALESRFDLAYNAVHAFSLAALRWHGYRSEDRYLVFRALEHTLKLGNPKWKVLDRCHRLRNRCEYEGVLEVTEEQLAELIAIAGEVLRGVKALGPPRSRTR